MPGKARKTLKNGPPSLPAQGPPTRTPTKCPVCGKPPHRWKEHPGEAHIWFVVFPPYGREKACRLCGRFLSDVQREEKKAREKA